MLDISKILGDHVPTGSGTGEKITPLNIINDMLNTLPDEVWNKQSKFLDIACKSGNFLREVYKRLFSHPRMIEEFPDDSYRKEYILHNQLYGITFNRLEQALASRNVYGYVCNENIVCIENWDNIVKNKDNRFLINKLKETFKDMNFNVVVGNPPYNNDIYLDFVTLGHNISSEYTLMITPAKWQAKGGDKNVLFRKNIVPYMSDIVIEHNCKEVFDIQETSGISYFLVDSKIHEAKRIKNICEVNKALHKDWEMQNGYRLWTSEINNIVDKCNTGESIKDRLSFKRFEFTAEQERGRKNRVNESDIEVMQGEKCVGYIGLSELYTTNNLDKYKVTSLILISMQVIFGNSSKILGSQNYNILKPNQVPKGSFPVLKYFDTEEECKSFVSYFNSKLMSFLFFIGVCGGTLTKEFYRFVPDPGNFDHIFTDEELYKKYGLTDEEIKIIESVIKERK